MHTKSFGFLALFAIAMVVTDAARAQSATAVEQVMVGISTQAKRLDTALTQLDEISKGLRGQDLENANQVATAGRQFSGAVGEAAPVGLILRHMKHRDDMQFTRAILAISASKAVIAADADTRIIDQLLPQISAPAAAVESAKIRDAILLTRNLLEGIVVTVAQNAPPASQPDSRTAAVAR
jgi:hypothetical protein